MGEQGSRRGSMGVTQQDARGPGAGRQRSMQVDGSQQGVNLSGSNVMQGLDRKGTGASRLQSRTRRASHMHNTEVSSPRAPAASSRLSNEAFVAGSKRSSYETHPSHRSAAAAASRAEQQARKAVGFVEGTSEEGMSEGGKGLSTTSAVSSSTILSFRKLVVDVGPVDFVTDQRFLEAVYIFVQGLPMADVWQDAVWQEEMEMMQVG